MLIPLKSHGVWTFTCHSTGLFSTFMRLRPFSFFSGPYAFHSLVSQVLRSVPLPLFNIIFASTQFVHPIHFFPFFQVPITLHFSSFLARVVAALGLDPRAYSPHSFRRGGATFAFECNVPAEHIKFQGDWSSDAYLV